MSRDEMVEQFSKYIRLEPLEKDKIKIKEFESQFGQEINKEIEEMQKEN